jgi:hypothetical protein
MQDFNQFKQCPKCDEWFSINDILRNPVIKPIGLKMSNRDPELGLFYFSHNITNCRTTFVIPIEQMKSFVTKTISLNLTAPTTECEHDCIDLLEVELCQQNCRNAPYRALLIEMINNKKNKH